MNKIFNPKIFAVVWTFIFLALWGLDDFTVDLDEFFNLVPCRLDDVWQTREGFKLVNPLCTTPLLSFGYVADALLLINQLYLALFIFYYLIQMIKDLMKKENAN